MRYTQPIPVARMAAITALFMLSAGLPARAADPDWSPGKTTSPAEARKVSDAKLELRVRDRLLTEVKSDAVPIRVVAMDGTVILSGEVESKAGLELAELTAKSTDGVKKLESKLTLAPAEKTNVVKKSGHETADAMLENKIKTKLLFKTGPRAFRIGLESTDGVVAVTGNPQDREYHDRVLQIARETTGVKEVHDLMKIEPDK